MRVGHAVLQSGLSVAAESDLGVHLESGRRRGRRRLLPGHAHTRGMDPCRRRVRARRSGLRSACRRAHLPKRRPPARPPSPGTLYRTFSIAPAHGTMPLRLGTRDAAVTGGGAVSYLTGGLDEVAIYPRVLTPAEILENYAAGRGQVGSGTQGA